MFTRIRLENFKSFREAEVALGPFTLVVGANASGKSNLRDAFRFLHGVGRGYSLAEALTERYNEAGEKVWSGVRGGVREIAFRGASDFCVQVDAGASRGVSSIPHVQYRLEVSKEGAGPPHVTRELLRNPGRSATALFEARADAGTLAVRLSDRDLNGVVFGVEHPVLPRVLALDEVDDGRPGLPAGLVDFDTLLHNLRFLDHDPEAMRRPAVPGARQLGQHGENLAAVLQIACRQADQHRTLLSWLSALLPMDVVDLAFGADSDGKVVGRLIDSDRTETSFASASDGTLRFLGLLARLLGPPMPAGSRRRLDNEFSNGDRTLFIEEIETGLHPSRLHLLVELLESVTAQGVVQVIATTHAPYVLSYLSEASLDSAVLAYRPEGSPATKLIRVMDLPDARRVLKGHDRAELHASGWLEDMAAFAGQPA